MFSFRFIYIPGGVRVVRVPGVAGDLLLFVWSLFARGDEEVAMEISNSMM